MKKFIVLCLLAGIGQFCLAQKYELQGKISDPITSESIPFARVEVPGAAKTMSDLQGSFSIQVLPTDSILVSASGYKASKIAVNGQKTIEITLSSLHAELPEMVITALGLKRNKRDLGYAIQTVKSKELTEIRNPNLVNSLAGRVAGVQTTSGSSGVGSSSRIIIRGETSLSGNNQPLFVVDGVPVSNDFIANNTENLENDFHEVDYGNGMGDFSSDDIESITVLKGPGAAALYGTRAANGVIVIETKEGSRQNGVGVSVNSSITFDKIAFAPQLQDIYGQGSGGVFAYEDGIGGGIGDGGLVSFGPQMNGQLITQYDGSSKDINGNTVRGGDVIARNGNPITPTAWNSNPDNVRSFFRTGVTSMQNVALSSAKNRNKYRFSYSRMDNQGTIPNTDYTRNNIALTANQHFGKKLSLRSFANFINSSSTHRPGLGYGSENALYSFLWMGRQVNLESARDYWQSGQEGFQQYNYNTQWLDNPFFNVYENTNGFNKNRVLGNTALKYQLNSNWSFRLRSGIDSYHDLRASKRAFSTQRFKNGAYREDDVSFTEINTDALLSYQKDFGTSNNWNMAFGANNFNQQIRYKSLTAGELSVPGIYNFGNSKIPLVASQYNAKKQINSLYAIFGFNLQQRFYIDATVRNDWSTTLPQENNSFLYYSSSIAWILSESINLPKWFTYSKLRLSTSSVGNDTDPFQLRNTYAFNQNYGSYPLLTNSSTLLNAQLRPERINALEAGTELFFFQDRLGIDFTWYQNTAKDQIIGLPASAASGFTNRIVNGGKIRSRGVELALTGEIVKKKNFTWTAFTNFTKGASYVIELPDGVDQYTTGYARVYSGTDNTVYYIANPDNGKIGDMYGTGFKKTADGQIIYDQNGLPVRDGELRYLGNYNPDFMLGFGSEIKYKNWSLNFLFDWRKGGTIVSRTKAIGHTSGVLEETLEGRENGIVGEGVVNTGTDQNPVYTANTKSVSAAEFYNQFYNRANEESALYDASYLKLRQIGISYRFPEKWLDKWRIEDFRIGVIAQNLFTITENPHFDPELSAMQGTSQIYGVEDLSYPSSRSLGFNIQFKF
ncbi:MAG: SusC/RagA family TonB-linked outer membrane protein [Bacteroidetes bacterium]|nr:MAG: SusC/RagA family TonB-linked outer membrane protein [Bacteroidota bacterium]